VEGVGVDTVDVVSGAEVSLSRLLETIELDLVE
jgi:hypothetical protein